MKPTFFSCLTLPLILSMACQAENSSPDTLPDTEPAIELDKVMVSANLIAQPLVKVTGSVSVINADDIAQQGLTELYEIFRNEPGVSITGGAGRPQNFIIRGMTGNRVAIIKDGIRSANGYGAQDINDQVGHNSFDLAQIKSLEVVKGASSSVHGSGAVGGIVAITSKEASDYLLAHDSYADSALTYTGISNKYKLASNLAFRSGKSENLVSLAYWQGEQTRNFAKNLYQRKLLGYSAAYQFNYSISDEISLSSRFNHYQENQIRNEGTPSIQLDGNWNIETFHEDKNASEDGFSLTTDYSPNQIAWFDNLTSRVFWRDTLSDEKTNRLMNQINQNDILIKRRELENKTFNDQIIGVANDFSYALIGSSYDHQLAYGFSLERNYFERKNNDIKLDHNGQNSTSKTPFAPAHANTYSSYFRDIISLANWTITTGLRFDSHQLQADKQTDIEGFELKDIASSEWSPSLSIASQITPQTNLYIAYNHAYRAPSYDKVYGFVAHDFIPFTPFLIIPNMDIKAETSDAIELGSKFDNGHQQLFIAFFQQKFNDFIDVKTVGFDIDTGNILKQYVNLNGVKTYGAELSAQQKITPRWSVNSKLGYVDGKTDDGENIRAITPWEGSLGVNYQYDNFSIYSNLLWADAMTRTPLCESSLGIIEKCATTSAWYTIDIGGRYEVSNNFILNANIINVFDRQYTRYQDVAGISATQVSYSTEPGRYVTLNAQYTF